MHHTCTMPWYHLHKAVKCCSMASMRMWLLDATPHEQMHAHQCDILCGASLWHRSDCLRACPAQVWLPSTAILRMLLEAGADPRATSNSGACALHPAVRAKCACPPHPAARLLPTVNCKPA